MQVEVNYWLWYLSELGGGIFVCLLLYFFIVKNKKINPPRSKRKDEEI